MHGKAIVSENCLDASRLLLLHALDRAYEALAPFRAVGLDTRGVDAEIDLARLALMLEAR